MNPIPRSRALARSISPIVALLACVACHDVGAETAQRKQRAGAAAAFIGSPGDRLVAHEWGTFISVQGSDGVSLEGVQNEVETLPSFVYSATRARASVFSDFGDASHTVPVRRVRGKGETPVIYFYSKRRRRVRVPSGD